MLKVENIILQDDMQYNGNIILTYKIKYPKIINDKYGFGIHRFNEYYKNKALQLQIYCQTELFSQAKQLYEYNSENGYPIMKFDVVQEYNVTYNKDNIISLYTDQYMYTGGAHGNTIRTSETWDIKYGRLIPLQSFFYNNPYYIIDIIKEINRQIAEQIQNGENQFFENYCELVLESFKLENYYLSPNYIEIYFQQYEIAPYSSGIPVFKYPLAQ